jgi:hypothetical protein
MAQKPFTQNVFSGGEATDKKVGISHSFANSQSLDFRKNPSQLTLLGRPTIETGKVVSDLVQNEVMTNLGSIYALGSTGKVYERSTANEWKQFGNIENTGAYGMTYRQDQDAIYIAGSNSISYISDVSKSPILFPNYYNISQSLYNNNDNTPGINVNCNQSGGTQTTAISGSFTESTTSKRYFQTDIEPLNRIGVYIKAKGTGDWTITVHDGFNSVLATSTVLNANVTNETWLYFTFDEQVRVNVAPAAQTYHYHITSTVAGGTVSSTSSNNLSTCDMRLWADRLVNTNNGMHPMAQIQQYIVIGNGRYLSVWEPLGDPDTSNLEWSRHYLQFPAEWEVCGIAQMNEYIAIACEKVSTDPDKDPQEGMIFWWDGIQKAAANVPIGAYNYFTPIPEGAPESIHSYKNVVYYQAGGSWYAISTVDSQPQKIRTLPFGENSYNNNNNETHTYPYAATTRNGIQLMAWPSVTKNENIPYGIYSWGQTDTTLNNSFGKSYVTSNGNDKYTNENNLTIGMIKSFGDTLHISWRDSSSENIEYGIDVVNSQSPLPLYATWESLIFDNGYTGKFKQANYMNVTYLPLPDGVEIVLKYSIDRGDWVYSPRYSNTNLWNDQKGYASFSMGESTEQGRFHEAQVGIDVYCEDGVYETPVITSVTMIFDDLANENLNNT